MKKTKFYLSNDLMLIDRDALLKSCETKNYEYCDKINEIFNHNILSNERIRAAINPELLSQIRFSFKLIFNQQSINNGIPDRKPFFDAGFEMYLGDKRTPFLMLFVNNSLNPCKDIDYTDFPLTTITSDEGQTEMVVCVNYFSAFTNPKTLECFRYDEKCSLEDGLEYLIGQILKENPISFGFDSPINIYKTLKK